MIRYRPLPNENALLRHIDGAHVDGSVILALPTDCPWEGGGVTVWEPKPHSAQQQQQQQQQQQSAPLQPLGLQEAAPVGEPLQQPPQPAGMTAGEAAGSNAHETSFSYGMAPGDLCLLDNAVWHQVRDHGARMPWDAGGVCVAVCAPAARKSLLSCFAMFLSVPTVRRIATCLTRPCNQTLLT